MISSRKTAGLHAAIWICLGIAAAGGVAAVALYTLGGGGLPVPDLDAWTGGEPAWESPPLLAWLRRPPRPPRTWPGTGPAARNGNTDHPSAAAGLPKRAAGPGQWGPVTC